MVVALVLMAVLLSSLLTIWNGTAATTEFEGATKLRKETATTISEIQGMRDELNLMETVTAMELGWDHTPATWLVELCPDVVEHFTTFPSFQERAENATLLPFLFTHLGAQAVCTVQVAQILAASLHYPLYLHAGSHLGAVVHGQPIPWDDDVDGFLEFHAKAPFVQKCRGPGYPVHPLVRLRCLSGFNSIKVWLHPVGMPKRTVPTTKFYSPFLDLFLFKIEHGQIWEVRASNRNVTNAHHFGLTDYFPTVPYYFGGIHVLGPPPQIAAGRYNLDICKASDYNHISNKRTTLPVGELDCTQLAKKFPFLRRKDDDHTNFISNGSTRRDVYPTNRAAQMRVLVNTTIAERRSWGEEIDNNKGQNLTDAIANLDTLEIDNTISTHEQCRGIETLRVVYMNLQRGRRWLEASSLAVVRAADVILLNEMDIGMARSDQQHTTRLLAHALGMNYAWGAEFVELTAGDAGDREHTDHDNMPNFHGLHGNAFLTRCTIYDPVLFRNPVGEYFSSRPNTVNAHGLEKRLGGRMGMFGRIRINGNTPLVIGSVHKLRGFYHEIKDYIGSSSSSVVAGDQSKVFCKGIGTTHIVSGRGVNTWPASCSSFGNHRGDSMCSSLEVTEEERTMKPCVINYGLEIQLGDHALISAAFAMPVGNDTVPS